ncbi:unnamed protein product [Gongylonema pulchrum]|uniref:Runt domain-containing protein n=1 Tax=Gongylonema pulchrum TaxID=637853 RepID=A0A183D4H8_9BILA|nr:unnamed protein product [Gongylonema pulchrum]
MYSVRQQPASPFEGSSSSSTIPVWFQNFTPNNAIFPFLLPATASTLLGSMVPKALPPLLAANPAKNLTLTLIRGDLPEAINLQLQLTNDQNGTSLKTGVGKGIRKTD